MYKTIDLFAGAGGLSCGFISTGLFDIKVAAENNPKAQATYIKNHPGVQLYADVRDIKYSEIIKKYGKIDVIIGGPPCQGFSNANRQKSSIVSNNNRLVKEYVRAILEVKPRAFVMENVGMLKSSVHRFFCSYDDQEIIERLGISTKTETIQLFPSEYEVSNINHIVYNFENYSDSIWTKEDYSMVNQLFKAIGKSKFNDIFQRHKNKLINLGKKTEVKGKKKNLIEEISYEFSKAVLSYASLTSKENRIRLETQLQRIVYFQGFLFKLYELKENKIITSRFKFTNGVSVTVQSYSVLDYIVKRLQVDGGYNLWSGVINAADYGVPQTRQRFILIGSIGKNTAELHAPTPTIRDPRNYMTIRDAIEDLEKIDPSLENDERGVLVTNKYYGKLKELRDSNVIYNHIATATREEAKKRFEVLKQGQNFHDLSDSLKTTYENVARTQNTIYLRQNYDEPSNTVVNVRKSMWIHPNINRAISVREAARLQSFPDSFVFVGTKDSQYQQVGNAVPPMLARAIALQLAKVLETNDLNRNKQK